MMTNLFSIFDPSSPNAIVSNWLAILIVLAVSPFSLWVSLGRANGLSGFVSGYILKEFTPLVVKCSFVLLMGYSLFIFVVMNNFMGLLPYVFTPTSHLAVTFALALSVWVSLVLFSLLNNLSNTLVHLIPQGTPAVLMPFMVLIESVSNLIRPLTLGVRLGANMVAGHLLITLLSSVVPVTPLGLGPVVISAQLALTSLEVAVSVIQGYVFSVLVTLYMAEAVN